MWRYANFSLVGFWIEFSLIDHGNQQSLVCSPVGKMHYYVDLPSHLQFSSYIQQLCSVEFPNLSF